MAGPGDDEAAARPLDTVLASVDRSERPPLAGQVEDAPYDPSRDRETKRGQIALRLLTLLSLIAIAPFLLLLFRALCFRAVAGEDPAAVCAGFPVVDMQELLTAVFTPVVALVGAATGFYFGEKKG